jgi:hypothetical protein
MAWVSLDAGDPAAGCGHPSPSAHPAGPLRARGQLAELGAADLRFTLEEATELLNERLGRPWIPVTW